MVERLTNEDEHGERLRHDEEPKAPWVALPSNVSPFLGRAEQAEAATAKLEGDTAGHYYGKTPEEGAVVHALNLTFPMSVFHPIRTLRG